jgi:hypothetical protein
MLWSNKRFPTIGPKNVFIFAHNAGAPLVASDGIPDDQGIITDHFGVLIPLAAANANDYHHFL